MLSVVRIVFATDGSRGAGIAEDFLLALPLSCADEVHIVTVTNVSERESLALLARCRWRFAARDIPTRTALRREHPADAAQAVALDDAADLVAIGSRGLGQWTGALMGSVARGLARTATCPLLVVRGTREAPRRVLLAVDGSAEARSAVDTLARLPLPAEARVDLLRIPSDEAGVRIDPLIDHARLMLGPRVALEEDVERGHLGEAVLRRALRTETDLIVLGSAGHTDGSGLLGTSIADHVLAHAHCAVLIAKTPLAVRYANAHATRPAIASA